MAGGGIDRIWLLKEDLVDKKEPQASTLQQIHIQGPVVVLGGVAVSFERGTPVAFWNLVWWGNDPQGAARREGWLSY